MTKIIYILLLLAIVIHMLPKNNLQYVSSQPQISKEETKNIEKDNNFHEIVERLNKKLDNIKSVQIEKIPIQIKRKNFSASTYGDLYFQKEQFFRLRIQKKLSSHEFDFGSNDNIFWFVSYENNACKLFFAKHRDIEKAYLKLPLYPDWLMQCMNISKIEYNQIGKFKNFIIIFNQQENRTIVILIDPIKEIIAGKYLYNKNGILIASAEYSANTIVMNWYEENLILTFDISKKQIDSKIDPQVWQMPKYQNSINLSQLGE